MKYVKVIAGLGLIPLGAFVGSFISRGGGNGAIIGGIAGLILCCILFFSFWPHYSRSANLDEFYMDNSDKQKQATDEMVQRMREAKINDELRMRGGGGLKPW
jgi:hypothetical protein